MMGDYVNKEKLELKRPHSSPPRSSPVQVLNISQHGLPRQLRKDYSIYTEYLTSQVLVRIKGDNKCNKTSEHTNSRCIVCVFPTGRNLVCSLIIF